jgi:50S ribosomal protein L16 3-hydroxylase
MAALVAPISVLLGAAGLATPGVALKRARVVAGEWDGFPVSRRAEFMRDYWNQKPLLIRNLLRADEANVLSPDELAGIACEDGVEARIFCEAGLAGGPPWALLNGPFDEADFANLPETSGWTLLVNEVNLVVPDVAALLARRLADVPSWRCDDVMVSYASKGGGIGAHVDNYDVFLLQGAGERRWEVEETPRSARDEVLVPGLAVRVLREFGADRSWTLRAGDCVYVPPRFAHRGTSLDDACMTYSIGYRAPKAADLVGGFVELAAEGCSADDFYTDPPLAAAGAQASAGELSEAALDALEAMVRERLNAALERRGELRAWLAAQVTVRKRAALEFEGDHADSDGAGLLDALARAPVVDGRVGELPRELRGLRLWRAEGVTFAFARAAALCAESPALFVDGERFDLAGDAPAAAEALAETLCATNPVDLAALPLAQSRALATALRSLALAGKIYFAPPEGEGTVTV